MPKNVKAKKTKPEVIIDFPYAPSKMAEDFVSAYNDNQSSFSISGDVVSLKYNIFKVSENTFKKDVDFSISIKHLEKVIKTQEDQLKYLKLLKDIIKKQS